MERIQGFQEFSENLKYHFSKQISLAESVFRPGSDSWLELINESRDLYLAGTINLSEEELWIVETDLGKKGIYENEEVLLDFPFIEGDEIDEAIVRGRKVDLNKPRRTPSGPRKFSVYTKNASGNVVKVNFGQPGMKVNNNDPKKARSFRKRMGCDNPGPKWKAKYWSCNVSRYAKVLGLKSKRPW